MKKILLFICLLIAGFSFASDSPKDSALFNQFLKYPTYRYFFGGNWTLSGAKNQWGNGFGFSSKSAAQLAGFNNASDTILLQVNRVTERPTFRFNVSDPWEDVAYLSDIPSVSGYLPISDTAAMLSAYTRIARFQDSLTTIRGRINGSGTLFTSAQPNITHLGTLDLLTVTGTIAASDISVTGFVTGRFIRGFNSSGGATAFFYSSDPSNSALIVRNVSGGIATFDNGAGAGVTINSAGTIQGASWAITNGGLGSLIKLDVNATGSTTAINASNSGAGRLFEGSNSGGVVAAILNNGTLTTTGSVGAASITATGVGKFGTVTATTVDATIFYVPSQAIGGGLLFERSGNTGVAVGQNANKIELYASAGVTATGSLTATSLIKSGGTSSQFLMADGSVTSLTGGLASGTYSPTVTHIANVSSSGAYDCQYMRVGSVVTVSGRVDLTPSAAGSTSTIFNLTLPVASNFANVFECAGSGSGQLSTPTSLSISADATNDRAQFSFASLGTGTMSFYFTFTYKII